ncbi:hypothetical protein RO3G_05248 [Rhizopus delemar RA 99-880]|uniref:Uncharacterized protein n=1 Tax=Rhizopus delemar (strain RA 99-880 / ATCC MYA-4621 / FGSC 9543 / NRRL 43880) TaxID=246409 RepID=I1BWG3_RHIO9|nr:hypothetical protein RO3G_05248 [Rhizopus delemar RA 99-880]|eukprot:EIE80543.1 hypothetical protein RO3G_05248 [Rhizopus delemar RA 99-880]
MADFVSNSSLWNTCLCSYLIVNANGIYPTFAPQNNIKFARMMASSKLFWSYILLQCQISFHFPHCFALPYLKGYSNAAHSLKI